MSGDRLYLWHIVEAGRRIAEDVADGYDSYCRDRRRQDAVIRNLEVIGEAAKRVSPALREAHPAIPWRAMTGMRDRLIHQYFGVNLDLVWEAAAVRLPEILLHLGPLVEQDPPP